jgi:hypothetical protein
VEHEEGVAGPGIVGAGTLEAGTAAVSTRASPVWRVGEAVPAAAAAATSPVDAVGGRVWEGAGLRAAKPSLYPGLPLPPMACTPPLACRSSSQAAMVEKAQCQENSVVVFL